MKPNSGIDQFDELDFFNPYTFMKPRKLNMILQFHLAKVKDNNKPATTAWTKRLRQGLNRYD